jgi:sortase A
MRRYLFWLEFSLFTVAAVTSGYVAYVRASAWILQEHSAKMIERLPQVRRSEAAVAPAEGTLLGEIEIPRLGASAPILEGTSDGTLRRAVGHIPGTALPGRAGNICLAGHRDSFFRPLRMIARGDEILVTTANGVSVYRVGETRIVKPDDVTILRPSNSDTLTLVTCYPFSFLGAAPQRFVVRARLVSYNQHFVDDN